ncbi:MAG: FtsX-like permease family protein, partial [Acidobacteriia bacterium]|nr:FtsX-like permease family protein [Terriglobia bacterium]
VAGLLFGLLPTLEAVNFSLAEAMKSQAASVTGMRLPWGRTLIAVQIVFSFVLLTAALLFIRTLVNYASLNLGFTPEHVLSVRIDPASAHYKPEQLNPLYHQVLASVNAVPGVQSASLAGCGLAIHCHWVSGIRIQDHPAADQRIQENFVTPGYFATAGMRLVAGRFFDAHDTSPKPIFAVINQAAAREYFPKENPLGRRFGYGGDYQYEIVGVVADAYISDVHEEIEPMAFYSLEQAAEMATALEIRAQGDPKKIEQAVRAALRKSAPNLPVTQVRLVTDRLAGNLLRETLLARLASAFAILALALACLGIYGVLSYAISRRTAEIGLRLALGAERKQVRWMVLREALAITGIGLAIGVPVSLSLTRLVKGVLYGLSASDPFSLAAAVLALLAIAAAAAFLPAWRASRVDPNVALRYE